MIFDTINITKEGFIYLAINRIFASARQVNNVIPLQCWKLWLRVDYARGCIYIQSIINSVSNFSRSLINQHPQFVWTKLNSISWFAISKCLGRLSWELCSDLARLELNRIMLSDLQISKRLFDALYLHFMTVKRLDTLKFHQPAPRLYDKSQIEIIAKFVSPLCI